jgi:hypothetical protein
MPVTAAVPGYSMSPTFKVDGGAFVTLNVVSSNWTEKVVKLVTTDTGTAGLAACIAGVLDGDGQVEANVSSSALYCAASPGIVAGAKGTITFPIGGATPFSIHVMIVEVGPRIPALGLVTYHFSVALDGTTGTYTRAA